MAILVVVAALTVVIIVIALAIVVVITLLIASLRNFVFRIFTRGLLRAVRLRVIDSLTLLIAAVRPVVITVVVIATLTILISVTVLTLGILPLIALSAFRRSIAIGCRGWLSVIHFLVASKFTGLTAGMGCLTDARTFRLLFNFVRFHNSAFLQAAKPLFIHRFNSLNSLF